MGVTLMKTGEEQRVVAIAKINCSDEIKENSEND
jgi:DNA gyrase subunit A